MVKNTNFLDKYIHLQCNGKVTDDIGDLPKGHLGQFVRLYMQVYEYNGEYYIDRIDGHSEYEHREHLVDIFVSPKIIPLCKIIREERLKNLLE